MAKVRHRPEVYASFLTQPVHEKIGYGRVARSPPWSSAVLADNNPSSLSAIVVTLGLVRFRRSGNCLAKFGCPGSLQAASERTPTGHRGEEVRHLRLRLRGASLAALRGMLR